MELLLRNRLKIFRSVIGNSISKCLAKQLTILYDILGLSSEFCKSSKIRTALSKKFNSSKGKILKCLIVSSGIIKDHVKKLFLVLAKISKYNHYLGHCRHDMVIF